METNASEFGFAGTLTQHGLPVAFFTRILYGPETTHVVDEKEAAVVVENLGLLALLPRW